MNSPNKTDQRKKREHNLPKSEFNKGIITTDPAITYRIRE